MGKDPAFLFYPGDYLRDTQNLSEKSQVAYDRIMCEHMRNLFITPQQLKFFAKHLEKSEKEELMMMLTKSEKGFQIPWVADSITKRRAYSESRRSNRRGKVKEDMLNTSTTYDPHMEDVNEDVNEDANEDVNEDVNEIKATNEKKETPSDYFDILQSVSSYFNVSEMGSTATAYADISRHLTAIEHEELWEDFKTQYEDFKQYKKDNQEIIGGWRSFFGDFGKDKGRWREKNWKQKLPSESLKEVKDKLQQRNNTPF